MKRVGVIERSSWEKENPVRKKNHKKDGFILQTLFVNNYITFWMFWLTFEPFYVIIFLNPWVLSFYRKIRTREKPVSWHILQRGRNLICWYFYFVRQSCSLLVLSLKEKFFFGNWDYFVSQKTKCVYFITHLPRTACIQEKNERHFWENNGKSVEHFPLSVRESDFQYSYAYK